MENKKYLLRGLIGGIITYVLFLFIWIGSLLLTGGGEAIIALPTISISILPVIPFGLFIGWIYLKLPKTAIFLSVVAIVFLVGLELLIFKHTFYPKPYAPQPSIYNGQPYSPQPSIIPGSKYKVQ